MTPPPLTEETLALAVRELATRDPDLAGIVDRFGPPPMWDRPAGFATLVHIMLEQQVSLASAQAAFDRLCAAVDPLTPDGFLALDDTRLLAIGFSRQKTRYCRLLAAEILAGRFDLDGLAEREDDEVRAALVALKGIGPWTAEIYLLMALLRPDSWPHGDLALASAAKEVFGLSAVPSYAALAERAEAWRPHRAVAARLLWHHYLNRG